MVMALVERMRLNFVNFGIYKHKHGMRQSLRLLWTHTHGSSFNSTPQIQHLTPPSHLRFHLLQFLLRKDLFLIFLGTPFCLIIFYFSGVILIIIWSIAGIAEGYWYDLSLELICYQPSLVRFLLLLFSILIILIFLDLGLIFLSFSFYFLFFIFVLLGFMGYQKTVFWGFRFCKVLL